MEREQAELELDRIQKQKDEKLAEQEAYDALEPMERPITWIMIIGALGSIVALPIIFKKARRGGF